MEVASQQCDTVPNKRHFNTVKIEKIFIHDTIVTIVGCSIPGRVVFAARAACRELDWLDWLD